MKRQGLTLVLTCALLAACGNAGQRPGLQGLGAIASGLANAAGGGQSAASQDPRQTMTREIIENAGQPILLAIIPSRNAAATLTVAGQNGDKVTWVSAGGQSVVTRDGLIIATRGLGDDLMGRDTQGGLAAILSGAETERSYEFLNGEDAIAVFPARCRAVATGQERLEIYERAYLTMKYTESCSAMGVTIQNNYWVGSDQKLRKSVQWVSFGVGSIEMTRL